MRQIALLFIGMVLGTVSTLSGVYFVQNLDSRTNAKSPRPSEMQDAETVGRGQGSSESASHTGANGTEPTESELESFAYNTLDDLKSAVQRATTNPSTQNYAEVLERMQLSEFADADIQTVEDLEVDLVLKLREQVKFELETYYKAALEAPDFAAGSKYITEAAGTLALYPMTEEASIIEEADDLTRRHTDIRFRLESIRRARYNVWAATVIEEALKILRAEDDNYRSNSLDKLAAVEPSLLEPSTSALYGYVIEQMMEEYNAGDKAVVAKTLNNPAVKRKTLEAF